MDFIFGFFWRIKKEELDILNIGQTTEYQNITEKTDIYYYAKVTDINKDASAFFYIHDLIYLNPDIGSRNIRNDELVFKGVYDTTLKIGNIYIQKSKL